MKKVNLYRYDEKHGIVVTPNIRNEGDPVYAYRLIADEGKILKNGDECTCCIDTKSVEGWEEVEDIHEDKEEV